MRLMMTCRFGLPAQVPVAAHHAHDGVVRLGAGAGEEHVIELRRRQRHQRLGELDRRRVRGLEEAVVVRQLEIWR